MRLNFFNRIRLNHRLKKGAQACVAELSQSIEEGILGTDDGLVEIVKKYFPKLDPKLREELVIKVIICLKDLSVEQLKKVIEYIDWFRVQNYAKEKEEA